MINIGSGALRGAALVLLTLALLCFATNASAQAGTVLATNGANQIQRATQVLSPLKPGTAVQSSDTLITDRDGRLQVRFVDGAIVSMQPGTQFRVDQYQFKEEESSSFFSLLRGAVRMASGLIGKKDPAQWRLTTPSATIGIRGTHFVVEHTVCDPDCSPGDKPGTRVAVTQGNVLVSNAAGSIMLGANQSAWVNDEDSAPQTDRWSPELAPRTVPGTPTEPGPGRSESRTGSTGGTDGQGSQNSGEPTQSPNEQRNNNEQGPRSELNQPISDRTNTGLRWQPDQINPFEPVREVVPPIREIALRKPYLSSDDNTSSDSQGEETDRNDQQDRSDNNSDSSYPDNMDSGSEDSNSNGTGDTSDTNATDTDNSSGNTTNTGGDKGSGNTDIVDISDPSDISDPTDVADPGDPTVSDPTVIDPVIADPGIDDPKPINPGSPGAPQIGSSIASNWFFDLRPMSDPLQRGLLADPQSAVTFSQGIELESIGRCNGGICLSRGSAMVADAGHDEYAAWGRWTNGAMHLQVFGLTTPIELSENEGLHYIVGSPTVSIPTSGSFTYNLTAATAPTMTHEWYSPGTFTGQASVQFSASTAPRVGLNGQVGLANDQFRFNTTGGAADPSQSELTLDSNLRFAGELDANGGHKTLPWMCGSEGCRARVEGALFGPTGQRLGVSYSIQSESGSTRINGVGIFSRP